MKPLPEDEAMAPLPAPSHSAAEAADLVDRYLLGKLPAAEAARFEEHYLACRACLERLEVSQVLVRGLRQVAGEDAARERREEPAPSRRRLRVGRGPTLLLAAAVALAVAGIALVERQVGRLAAELRQVRLAQAAQGLGGPTPQRAAAVLDPFVAFLSPVRSAGEGAEPIHTLRLGTGQPWVVLVLELDDPSLVPCRAALLREGAGRVWEGAGPSLQPGGVMTLAFPASLLAEGTFTVQLFRLEDPPGAPPQARFTFTVNRQP